MSQSRFLPGTNDPMRLFVFREVHNYIKKHKRIPSEMKAALKGSDHIKNLTQNLTRELRAAQDFQLKRRGKGFKDKTLRDMVHEFTEIFLLQVEAAANKKRESMMAAYKREHAGDETKEFELALAGKSTGAFEDMGLVIPEDQRTKPNDGA